MIKAAYLHIPFCEHICHYCDFNKVFLKGQPVDQYLQALDQEMKLTLKEYPAVPLETIFVGGGTPTSLNEQQLYRFCESIRQNLPRSSDLEFTFEANPGDLSTEKLQILKEAGVNRLSLGVQTFNDELLKKSAGSTVQRTSILPLKRRNRLALEISALILSSVCQPKLLTISSSHWLKLFHWIFLIILHTP